MHKAHTEWGKERINQEMTKANNWVALVSRNTVRRILEDAGMWSSGKRLIKKSWLEPVARTADAPGQTLNVDLLFVPSCHLADMKLPAVSGSSGDLVVERLQEAGQEKQYPGRVFENTDLDYEEVVKAFIDASRPFDRRKKNITGPPQTKIQLLRQEEIKWSNDRREVRNLRILEDVDWKLIWKQHRDERKSNRFGLPRPHASWGVSKQKAEKRKNYGNIVAHK